MKEETELYFGYCLTPDDMWTPKVTLRSAEEVYKYTQLQKMMFKEVRITDSLDFTVCQAKNGKYTYPPEWVKLNNRIRQ